MMEILNKGYILGGKGASMIDTTKFIEILPGIWYEIATGKPWSSKVTIGFGEVSYDGKLKELKCKNPKGYVMIKVSGKAKTWHKLVYQYFKGNIPKGIVIDHKNNIRDDNRIDNLQLSTNTKNTQKHKIYRSNNSGFNGVHYRKDNNCYRAYISVEGERHNLGHFETPEEAYEAYLQAKIKYHGIESISPLKGI